MNIIRVLIVEDDPMVAHINKSFTDAVAGFKVTGTENTGQGALEYLRGGNVDLVILDVFLPRMSGIEVLNTIRQERSKADVIVISAANDCEIITQALRLGIIAYIEKPFEFNRYRSVLEAYRDFFYKKKKQQNLKQDDIDGLRSFRLRPDREKTPKNLTPQTMGVVMDFLAMQTGRFSTEEVAAGVGLSRATTRRYLEHLTQEGLVCRMLKYPAAGRPTYMYSQKRLSGRPSI